jgi:hypothetical protein
MFIPAIRDCHVIDPSPLAAEPGLSVFRRLSTPTAVRQRHRDTVLPTIALRAAGWLGGATLEPVPAG